MGLGSAEDTLEVVLPLVGLLLEEHHIIEALAADNLGVVVGTNAKDILVVVTEDIPVEVANTVLVVVVDTIQVEVAILVAALTMDNSLLTAAFKALLEEAYHQIVAVTGVVATKSHYPMEPLGLRKLEADSRKSLMGHWDRKEQTLAGT